MISYAGTPLLALPADLVASAQARIDPSWHVDFPARTWPLAGLASLDQVGHVERGPIRLGVLSWPQGAQRFATFYGLVGESQLAAIRAVAGGGAAAPLVIGDGRKSLTASMHALPARPLEQVAKGTPALYLLTLVDQRYRWWFRAYNVASQQTWSGLYIAAGIGLGVSIAADAISAAYGVPPAGLVNNFGVLPPLLDATAAAVGQRIAVDYDGTVHAYGVATSKAIFSSNLALAQRLAGNVMDLTAPGTNDLNLCLPGSFTCVFQNARESVTVTLASLALPEFVGVAGFSGSKVFNCPGAADVSAAALATYATQAATDYYRHAAARGDVVYEGAVAWKPEGLTWLVEIEQGADYIRTRARRQPWLDHAGDDQSVTNPAVMKGEGDVYAITWEPERGGVPALQNVGIVDYEPWQEWLIEQEMEGPTAAAVVSRPALAIELALTSSYAPASNQPVVFDTLEYGTANLAGGAIGGGNNCPFASILIPYLDGLWLIEGVVNWEIAFVIDKTMRLVSDPVYDGFGLGCVQTYLTSSGNTLCARNDAVVADINYQGPTIVPLDATHRTTQFVQRVAAIWQPDADGTGLGPGGASVSLTVACNGLSNGATARVVGRYDPGFNRTLVQTSLRAVYLGSMPRAYRISSCFDQSCDQVFTYAYGVLPATLTLTIANVAGCACAAGSYTVHWVARESCWTVETPFSSVCGKLLVVSLYPTRFGRWQLVVRMGNTILDAVTILGGQDNVTVSGNLSPGPLVFSNGGLGYATGDQGGGCNGALTYTFTATGDGCTGGSGSATGSGSTSGSTSGGSLTSCCPTGLPNNLTLTISNVASCACFAGSISLMNVNNASWNQIGQYTGCSHMRLSGASMTCQGSSWQLDFSMTINGVQTGYSLTAPGSCTTPIDFGQIAVSNLADCNNGTIDISVG